MLRLLLSLFLCLYVSLPGETITEKAIDNEALNIPLIDLESIPSAIVGGAVNVITGSYIENECDFYLPGANPLTLTRTYNSSFELKGTLCHGWDFNHLSTAHAFYDAIIRYEGTSLHYDRSSAEELIINKNQLIYGITNCSGRVLSARTNIKNRRIDYVSESNRLTLYDESGDVISYRDKPKTRNNFVPFKKQLPNEDYFDYEYDHDYRLGYLKAYTKNKTFISSLQWQYPHGFRNDPYLVISSSDGRKTLYNYQRTNSKYYLKSVIKNHGPNIIYELIIPGRTFDVRLAKKLLPDNRFLKIEYYEEGKNTVRVGSVNQNFNLGLGDIRRGRVASLYAPVGKYGDKNGHLIWSFKYNLNNTGLSGRPIGGKTEVTDALGHRKIYYFSDEQRLTEIQHFFSNGNVYRTEKMVWDEIGDEKTFLLARGMLDSNEELVIRRDYEYDILRKGNVKQEIVWGNLSGWYHDSLSWKSYRDAEKFCKYYSYYSATDLLYWEDDRRQKITYSYFKSTDKIVLKLVANNEGVIQERYHFEYGPLGTLVKETIDDGNSEDINNLNGATYRLIKKITPTSKQPIGLPEVIEECYYDLCMTKEILLKRQINSYDGKGNLKRQEVYDSNGIFSYSKIWTYDDHGNIKTEINPLGQETTYDYDDNDNLIYRQTPNHSYHTQYDYDYANRLIKQTDFYTNGLERTLQYTYDFMGNRTSSTDAYGNKTIYRYDEFGRMIERKLPSILDKDGNLTTPIDKIAYDCMNNPCEKTDTNAFTTRMKYSSWNKPYLITYPDGGVEKHYYLLDGTLEKTVDPKGVITTYSHDYKKQKTKEEKFSNNGNQLSLHQWIYKASHLISEIDPEGHETTYSYDGAGRLTTIEKGEAITKYTYDSLGRKKSVQERYENEKYRHTIYEYDYLDRITSESIVDDDGSLLSKISYGYDEDGNRKEITIHDNNSSYTTQIEFNGEHKPLKITHPDGTEVSYSYRYDYKNSLGQGVAYEEEIDPNKIHHIKIMDVNGKLALEERKDSSEKLLQRTRYQYDGEGNLILRTDDVIIDGEIQQQIQIGFQYDCRNRRAAVIEALGDPLQKTRKYRYTLRGELEQIIKPDDVILHHTYDDLGRLIDLAASDGSVHYVYSHDLYNNIIGVKDLVLGLNTLRIFNDDNRLISETLGTGFEFTYEYDKLGRIKKATFPDKNSACYTYNGKNLIDVDYEKNGQLFHYSYRYHLSGKLAETNYPNDLGSFEFTYNNCLRPLSAKSKYWSQIIPKDGYDPSGNLLQSIQHDAVGQLISTYSYDGLNHLISETGLIDHTYAYDSVHNRIDKNGILHQVNALNQLTQQGDVNYEYDFNGNHKLRSGSDNKTQYHYDGLDRLIAIVSPDSKIEYDYDAFHRRLKKTSFTKQADKWLKTKQCNFLYQGDIEIGEVDENNSIVSMRLLGLSLKGDVGSTLLLEIGQQFLCPLHDLRGNIVALIDAKDGRNIECYRYTAFGEEKLFDGLGNSQQSALSPWRFSSKRIDPESGWAFFGRRYYDPEIGRWTTPDPLDFNDGPNLYCFVHNRPMIYIDPDGRFLSAIGSFIGENYETMMNTLCQSNTAEDCSMTYTNFQECHAYQPGSEFFYSQIYSVGTPHDDGKGMAYINGVRNTLQEAISTATMLSDIAGGREVKGVYNVSFGPLDFFESGLNLCGVATPPSILLADLLASYPPEYQILLAGHSQGVIHIKNATPHLDEDLRQRISVLAIAPGAMLPDDTFKSARHYASFRDFVPMADMLIHGTYNHAPLYVLTPHPKASWHDHGIQSPTFSDILNQQITTHINQ